MLRSIIKSLKIIGILVIFISILAIFHFFSDLIWLFIAYILITLGFISSLRLSFLGYKKTGYDLIDLVTHRNLGYFSLFTFVPAYTIAGFGSGEMSPIPWIEFMESYTKFGLMDGMLSFILVLTIDLWLFWIPGNLEIKSTSEISKRYKVMIRFLNISVGLLLITPNNPIYKIGAYLVGWLFDKPLI